MTELLSVGDILWNEPCDERIVVIAANDRNVWLRKVQKNDEFAMHDGHVWAMLGKKCNVKNMCTQSYAQSTFELDGHVEQAIAVTLGSDDEYEAKMDELLCYLTNGKFSKSRQYSLDFMKACVDEEYEDAYNELNAERDERKARISELEKQWDARDSDCIALEAKVNRLEDEIADWSELHAQVLSERNHVIAERDEWKTKCETREFAYKQADAERKRYSEQIDELRAERDEWKAKLADMNADRHVETCGMEYQTDGMMSGWWKCSVCGEAMDTIKACAGREKPKYCGNCGRLVVA